MRIYMPIAHFCVVLNACGYGMTVEYALIRDVKLYLCTLCIHFMSYVNIIYVPIFSFRIILGVI